MGCSVNPNNSPPDKIEALIPLTGGNNYFEDELRCCLEYDRFPSAVPGYRLPPHVLDNGAGISWNFSIPAGELCHILAPDVNFCSWGLQGLVTSKTADSPTSPAGTQNGYTITIKNPNAFPVTVSSITDTLPAGFAYVGLDHRRDDQQSGD